MIDQWAPPQTLLVLAAVGHGERYGYEIAAMLRDAGLDGLNEATVYAALRRLESEGMLTSRRELADNGRARRYYRLTGRGHQARKDAVGRWTDTKRVVDAVISRSDGG